MQTVFFLTLRPAGWTTGRLTVRLLSVEKLLPKHFIVS